MEHPLLRRQRGSAAVEFGLVGIVFFTLLLGIMELGRMLYVWNTVQEVTRRAAREAAVRDFTTQVPYVQYASIFRPTASGTAYLPAGAEITNLDVRIAYLNGSLTPVTPAPTDPADNVSACNDASRMSSCIRYVQACVATDSGCASSVVYRPVLAGMFPFLAISIPVSSVILPAESLGFYAS